MRDISLIINDTSYLHIEDVLHNAFSYDEEDIDQMTEVLIDQHGENEWGLGESEKCWKCKRIFIEGTSTTSL